MNKLQSFKASLAYFKLCSKFSKEFLALSKELDNQTALKMLDLCTKRINTIIYKKLGIK